MLTPLFSVLALAALAMAQQGPPQLQPVGRGDPQPMPASAPAAVSPAAGFDMPYHRPRFLGELSFGAGGFEHRTRNSTADDRTTAGFFRLQFEGFARSGIGGGIRLEAIGSDDDLFQGTGNPVSQSGSGEVFLYFAWRPAELALELPLRIGLSLSNYGVEENVSGNRIDYGSLGVRVEAMPDIPLVEDHDLRLSLYGGGSFGVGFTRVATDPDTFEADATTTLFGLDAGLRLRFSHASFGVGWLYRDQRITDSDAVGGVFYNGIEQSFWGVQLTFGLTF